MPYCARRSTYKSPNFECVILTAALVVLALLRETRSYVTIAAEIVVV